MNTHSSVANDCTMTGRVYISSSGVRCYLRLSGPANTKTVYLPSERAFFFIIVFFVHIFFYNFPLTHSVNTYNNSYKYILYRRPHHRKVQQRIVSAGDKFEYLRLHYIVVRYAFSFFLLYAYNNIYSPDDTLKATSSAFLLNCF